RPVLPWASSAEPRSELWGTSDDAAGARDRKGRDGLNPSSTHLALFLSGSYLLTRLEEIGHPFSDRGKPRSAHVKGLFCHGLPARSLGQSDGAPATPPLAPATARVVTV